MNFQIDSIDAWPQTNFNSTSTPVVENENSTLIDEDLVLQRKLTLDASLISTVFIMVITSSFLQINYMFKLMALILTGLIHMLLYGCLIAEGVDHLEVTNRYTQIHGLGLLKVFKQQNDDTIKFCKNAILKIDLGKKRSKRVDPCCQYYFSSFLFSSIAQRKRDQRLTSFLTHFRDMKTFEMRKIENGF